MDPQLLMPSPAADFIFDSTSTSPYATAPSSPNILFPRFFPATSQVTHDQNNHEDVEQEADDHMDFAFDFSGHLDRPSISDAEELFDGGKIKPLKPPPPPSTLDNPRSHRKINLKKPFSEAFHRTPEVQTQNPSPRGRNRTTAGAGTRQKASRSLSPMRVSDAMSDDRNNNRVVSSNQISQFGFTWYNKWNLKNLLLFRSTSEGSAAAITKDVKNSSFRSCDGGGGSVGGSSRRRMKRKVSAHEIHYTANRAVAEEMRRKTFLPYRSGLLGCLGFGHT